jgi:hypothetical protein
VALLLTADLRSRELAQTILIQRQLYDTYVSGTPSCMQFMCTCVSVAKPKRRYSRGSESPLRPLPASNISLSSLRAASSSQQASRASLQTTSSASSSSTSVPARSCTFAAFDTRPCNSTCLPCFLFPFSSNYASCKVNLNLEGDMSTLLRTAFEALEQQFSNPSFSFDAFLESPDPWVFLHQHFLSQITCSTAWKSHPCTDRDSALNSSCIYAAALNNTKSFTNNTFASKELRERNMVGCTPAIVAGRFGHVEILQYIKRQSAEMIADADSVDGTTSLLWASRNGHFECINPLFFLLSVLVLILYFNYSLFLYYYFF